MADRRQNGWSSTEGIETLRSILKRLIPQWPNGPYDWQLTVTANVLDGRDQLLVTACGDGKTAAAYLHLLVRQELYRDPKLPRYGAKVVQNPVGIMVGPLVDLGISQVAEMERVGVRAVALDTQSITKAQEQGKDLYKEVKACSRAMVIVSPERLTAAVFDKILRHDKFRDSLVSFAADEAHIIAPWALDFRLAYWEISRARLRIPQGVPMLAMTATLRMGSTEHSLVRLLGFRQGYHTLRRSSERKNVQTVYTNLSHGLDGYEFPDIAWVARGKKKVVIYCKSIDLCQRVTSYLRRLRPPGPSRLRNIRMYHSFKWADSNAETLKAFQEDPDTFCIVATIKFGMGVDVRNIDVIINLGLPDTIENDHPQRGRAMRDPRSYGVGITYCEMGIVSALRK
ncbi:P-loop containing nucleoside triphosphate hydrolase protein, partial [Panus rudis PR-1116 ss-1]